MANVTAYIHPERLLIATWFIENGVAVVQDYKELAPNATVDLRNIRTDTMQLIVHSSHVRLHWYPVAGKFDTIDRAEFEQQTWFETSEFRCDAKVTISTLIHGTDYDMKAAVAIADQALNRCEILAGSDISIATDYEMDLYAALASTKPRLEPWMLLGRRGAFWYATIIDANHRVIKYATFPHDSDYSNQAMTSLILNAVTQRYEIAVSAILVYGDVVTAEEIQETKNLWSEQGIKVGRLQPFRTMQSMLDDKTAQRLLRRAHVVSPLAGAILHQQQLITA